MNTALYKAQIYSIQIPLAYLPAVRVYPYVLSCRTVCVFIRPGVTQFSGIVENNNNCERAQFWNVSKPAYFAAASRTFNWSWKKIFCKPLVTVQVHLMAKMYSYLRSCFHCASSCRVTHIFREGVGHSTHSLNPPPPNSSVSRRWQAML
jgi:hypothetical protein